MSWSPNDKEYGGINDQGHNTAPFNELFKNLHNGNEAFKWSDDSLWWSDPLDGSSILDMDDYPKILIVTPQVAEGQLKYPKELDAIQKWLDGMFDGVPVSRQGYQATNEAVSENPSWTSGKILVQFNPNSDPGNV